jgi:hypothetical protein
VDEWSASHFTPGKRSLVPIVQETGWAPEPVWMQRIEVEFFASIGDQTPVIQLVVRYYTDCCAWITTTEWNIVRIKMKLIICPSVFVLFCNCVVMLGGDIPYFKAS